MPAFNTTSGLPLSSVNLADREGIPDRNSNGWVSTAEVATLQLEWRYLSELTEDEKYWRAVEKVRLTYSSIGRSNTYIFKVMAIIKENNVMPRLVTIYMEYVSSVPSRPYHPNMIALVRKLVVSFHPTFA